jgi:hypothetical protein
LRHDFFRFFNMSNKYLDYANTLKKKIIEFLLKR